MSAAVEVRDLRRSFGQVCAVDGATWSAESGCVTAVLGPNGAGKTTMIEILEGLGRADAGSARVLGIDPWGASADHRARVGVMLQDGGLPTRSRPIALLRHLGRLYAGPSRVEELVRILDLEPASGTMIRRLSGGQRQRVALAAALLGRPDVAFLDEPTAGLDPHARLDVWELIRGEADRGAAVVVTTHSFEEAERLADRVVIVAAGRVVASGPLSEVAAGTSLEERYFSLTRRQAAG